MRAIPILCYNAPVVIRYQGRAFRQQHKVSLRTLAAGAHIGKATLIQVELGRRPPTLKTVDRVCAYFAARGIRCTPGDLLVHEPDPPSAEEGPG